MSGIPLVHPFGEPPKIRSSFDWAQGERIFGGSTALFRIKRFRAYPDFHDYSLFQNLKQIAVVIGPQFYRRAVACHPVGMVPDRRDIQQGRIARQ
jgi:hypothetical protein